ELGLHNLDLRHAPGAHAQLLDRPVAHTRPDAQQRSRALLVDRGQLRLQRVDEGAGGLAVDGENLVARTKTRALGWALRDHVGDVEGLATCRRPAEAEPCQESARL